ncbi:hypothetical protein [Nocardia macrotermitis]|uniref:Uncharacterized protein n=1 Tax=Nocardia macrotermitis TaxID=2585198 RepID=A0A7K0DD09_9NOCA|nr:hypothetical protein [Nocardia macrotermitis]MQY23587.1 hypothetical protein [Nocardia macrotermitis]
MTDPSGSNVLSGGMGGGVGGAGIGDFAERDIRGVLPDGRVPLVGGDQGCRVAAQVMVRVLTSPDSR